MIELSEELKQRKEEWRRLGFLLPNETSTKGREYGFEFWGREWIAEIRTSTSGLWDTFLATGNVRTNSISIHKVRYMSKTGEVLEAKEIIFFKWVVTWASWDKKTGEQ